MKYIDITKSISTGMKKYPSDPSVRVSRFKSLKKGDSCNLSKLALGSHSGTHIDAPYHIFNNTNTVDKIAIKDLICKVLVADIKELSQEAFLKKTARQGIGGVLLKDGKRKAYLTIEEAKVLVKNKIKVIGTEQMSIENSPGKSHPVHNLLLSEGVIIIETLDLGKVKPGRYRLICLPLKIAKGDGAPARVILIDD